MNGRNGPTLLTEDTESLNLYKSTIMDNYILKPQLGFSEAVNLAMGRLTDINGRSRRSEFWWFMLVFLIAQWLIGMILALFLSPVVCSVINSLLWLLAFAVTARRLHDTGRSTWWVILGWMSKIVYGIYMSTQSDSILAAASSDPTKVLGIISSPVPMTAGLVQMVTSIAILVFCLLDSHQGANKYGPSPKYAEQ